MKTNHKKKTLTFGEFITGIYDASGRQKAGRIVLLAVKAHWIEFCGHDRLMIFKTSTRNPPHE